MNELELLRYTLTSPGDLGTGQAHIFSDTASALAHLRDHTLTAPESLAWARVFEVQGDSYDALVGDEGFRARARMADRIFATPREGQTLYEAYARSICQAIEDAAHWGWIGRGRTGHSRLLWGRHGVLVVLTIQRGMGHVISAYLPGHGVAGDHARHDSPALMREAPHDPMRHARLNAPSRARQTQRRADWSAEQRLFYDVVRPALQHLTSEVFSVDPERQQERRELLTQIKRAGKLRHFEVWQQLAR